MKGVEEIHLHISVKPNKGDIMPIMKEQPMLIFLCNNGGSWLGVLNSTVNRNLGGYN